MDFMLIQSYLDKIPSLEDFMNLPEVEELAKKYSKVAVEGRMNAILDKRHLKITTSKNEEEVENLDFSMPFYIESLKEELSQEREIGSKKVLNLMGNIYSKHIGNKFYSEEVLKEFVDNFSSYNTLNYDLKNNKGICLKEEISDFLKNYNKDKDYLLLSSVSGALYTVVKSFYDKRKMLCSIKESYTFSNGSDMLKTIREAGSSLEVVGTINSLSREDYEKSLEKDSVVLHSDLMGNKLEGLAVLESSQMDKLLDVYENIFVTDKIYLSTEVEEIKERAYGLSDLTRSNALCIADLSKLEDFPESALIIGDKDKIAELKNSIYAGLFSLSKESEVLFYLNLKNKLNEENKESYSAKILAKSEEDVKEANLRFIELIQHELDGIAQVGIMEGPYLKVEEQMSYQDAFNRELLVISPLEKDSSEVERVLRMSEPAILCWINEGNLIFNLQLINENEEIILAEKIIDALKG